MTTGGNHLEKAPSLAEVAKDVERLELETQGIWNDELRPMLFDMLAQGSVSPFDAEAMAAAKGLAPLLKQPDPALPVHDPMTADWWTLGMAITWMCWRDLLKVRYCWPRYAGLRQFWKKTATGFAPGGGPAVTASMLLHAWSQDGAFNDRNEVFMTPQEAVLALFQALARGQIEGIARNVVKQRVDPVGQLDWAALSLVWRFEGASRPIADYLTFDGAAPHLTDAMVQREGLLRVWSDAPDEAPRQLIQPPVAAQGQASRKGRGRPKGTGINDEAALAEIRRLIREDGMGPDKAAGGVAAVLAPNNPTYGDSVRKRLLRKLADGLER